MESCSLYKSLQKLVHLEGNVDISKVIMKKPYPGHLLIFVHNGKAALAKVHLYKHRKNCECCPGHYLIVNQYSSI